MPEKSRLVWCLLQPLVIVLLLVGGIALFFGVPAFLSLAFEEHPTLILVVALPLALLEVFLVRQAIRR